MEVGEVPRPALTAQEWERRLVAHYLREDGPFGGSVLRCIDATPAELAIVGDFGAGADLDVQRQFVTQLGKALLFDWLDGRRDPPIQDGEGPGYFRFLVLTALVSATDEGAGATRDFRKRLGELVGHGGPVQAVSGVNQLWEALASWADRRRALGEPIRRVALPGYGNATLIGRALAIAFPSWRDRQILTDILERLPTGLRRSPRHLVEELSRPQYDGRVSANLSWAFKEFARDLRQGRADIADHRFWRLVESVEQRLEANVAGRAKSRWRIDATFTGPEQDEVLIEVSTRGPRGSAGASLWSGSFREFVTLGAARLPAEIVRLRDAGILVLGEAAGAVWRLDDLGPPPSALSVVLLRKPGPVPTSAFGAEWAAIGAGWRASAVLDAAAVQGVLQAYGLASAEPDRLVAVGLEDGVATRRGGWLGRTPFLPRVIAPEGARLDLSRLVGSGDGLRLAPDGRLAADRSVEGRWRLTAEAGGVAAEQIFHLETDAAEKLIWPEVGPEFETEAELSLSGAEPLAVRNRTASGAGQTEAMADLMEAVYARGSSPWGEAEFVGLVDRIVGRRGMAWDIMRAFTEAGWTEVHTSRGWRGRKWRLLPPSLVGLSPQKALVEGALSAAGQRRLADAVSRSGGNMRIDAELPWSPGVVVVEEVDVGALAVAMEWPLELAERPMFVAAPNCWPREPRTTTGRELVGVWSFDECRFVRSSIASTPVRLERWVRERGDDRDVYRVDGRAGEWMSTSRTAAILEAHRRLNRPLFGWSDGRLSRAGQGGHLPLSVARTLRRSNLRPSGPVVRQDGAAGYVYAADSSDAVWLRERLGAAVHAHEPTSVDLGLTNRVVAARRAVRPLAWFQGPHGRRAS